MAIVGVRPQRRTPWARLSIAVCFVFAMACASVRAQAVLWVAGPGAAAGQYATVGEAVAAAPASGAEIRIRPGVYREVVHVDKANIQLRGEGGDARAVEIVYANGLRIRAGRSARRRCL